MADRPGVPGTTSQPRSSITSSPTTSFPTGFMAASRKVGRSEPPAAVTLARSLFATGRRSASKKDRKSTRLNSSHQIISYAVFCLKKKKYILDLKAVLHHIFVHPIQL